MPISSQHPEYESSQIKWSRVRDVKSGSDAVKSGGDRYLPRLGGQSASEYDNYRYRAMFLPVVARTIRTLVGLSTFKRPTLTGPAVLDDLEESIGTEGQPLDRLAASVMEEQVSVGRVGALVDVDPEDSAAPPAVSLYHAENIINWDTTMIRGREVATTVVLREKRLVKQQGDPYAREDEEIYRELGFGIPPARTSPSRTTRSASPTSRPACTTRSSGLGPRTLRASRTATGPARAWSFPAAPGGSP